MPTTRRRHANGSVVLAYLALAAVLASVTVIVASPVGAVPPSEFEVVVQGQDLARHVVEAPDGDVIFADMRFNTLHRVDATTGNVSTIAGQKNEIGYSGDGGPASQALLSRPTAVAVTSDGTIYFADQVRTVLRKIDADGVITTIAGTGSSVATRPAGDALTVGLGEVTDLQLDRDGSLLLANAPNGWISRLDTTTGRLSVVAGTGTSGTAGEGASVDTARISPAALAVDRNGDIYYSAASNQIRKIDSDAGRITVLAGNGNGGYGGDGGPAKDAALARPRGIAIDDANMLYIANSNGIRVRRVDLETGVIDTLVAFEQSPSERRPFELSIASDGALLVSFASEEILRLNNPSVATAEVAPTQASAGEVEVVWFPDGVERAQTDQVGGIVFYQSLAIDDDGTLLVSTGDRNVIRLDPETGVAVDAAFVLWDGRYFAETAGLAFDSKGNRILGTTGYRDHDRDARNEVWRWDRSSNQFTTRDILPEGQEANIRDIAIGPDDLLYVADEDRIVTRHLSTGELGVLLNNEVKPRSLSLSADANRLLVADEQTQAIIEFDLATNAVSTVAEIPNVTHFTVDGGGNLFVATGISNPTIVRVDAVTSEITTVVGLGAPVDGDTAPSVETVPALEYNLSGVHDLAIDADGTLWIAEGDRVSKAVGIAEPVATPTFAPPLLCGGLPVTIDLAEGDVPESFGEGQVIRGTAGDDVISGSILADVICGLQGNDTISAGGGFDKVFGGAGDDRISGATGNDRLVGGPGNDIINAGPGNDRVLGGPGADVINGGNGEDRLAGGTGNDIINGGRFADELLGNQGRDQLFGGDGNDILRGGLWIDSLDGGAQTDACSTIEGENRVNCETGLLAVK